MGLLDDIANEQFGRWEERGRGWKVWPHPVPPEPAFLPFHGFRLPQPNPDIPDDGHRPGLIASVFDAIEKALNPRPPMLPDEPEPEEPEPLNFEREPLVELQTALPAKLDIDLDEFGSFLEQLTVCKEPVTFELLALPDRIVAQFAAHKSDTPTLLRQLKAHFSEVTFVPEDRALANAWLQTKGETAIVEFGLEREFMFPLSTGNKVDPFVSLIGEMSELHSGELALFQVLFQPVDNDWATSAWRSVTDKNGQPLFVNRPELTKQAKEKLAFPLYGVVVRIATKAAEFDRAWSIVRELSFALGVFAFPKGNALVPLHNDDYPFEHHQKDVVARQSRRSGILINSAELTGLVHFPSPAVRSAKLSRQLERTRAAPAIVCENHPFVLGVNRHMGKTVTVSLSADQRVRHMHLIGATGTGKSNLLFNLICQDIENGEGVGVLDPHGDLIERVLRVIPPERIDDVVLVDPSDEEFSVGFNILSAHSDHEKALLASDLVSVFQRLSTSWGDQMGSVLQNAILAFLESREGGTLADLQRFLVDATFRREFLKSVTDPEVVFYWEKVFPQLTGNKSVGPVLTRLNNFLAKKPIRYMVSQRVNRLDFGKILDTGKIFLAKLPQGLMGKENAFLLGSLLMSKFQQLAMSRQRMEASLRRDFWLYVDEFHHFITPSMGEILTGARKYRVGLILSHQELRQLQRDSEVASTVMSISTRAVFRVGDGDARALESGFSYFDAHDLQNLGTGEAVCRVERSDFDFNLRVLLRDEPDPAAAAETRRRAITASREKYATPRAEVEAALAASARSEQAPSPGFPRVPPSARSGSEVPPTRQPSEVPNPAASAKEQPAARSPQPPMVVPTSAPQPATATDQFADATSADAQTTDNYHDDAKKQITDEATGLDYTVTPEQWVLQGSARVDLVLERGGRKVACEVCATSTAEQEVAHITARLQAGFTDVAVVCKSHLRLSRIQQKIVAALPPDQADRVGYYHLAEFIAQLREWARQDPAGGEVERARLRRRSIKLDDAKLSGEERQRHEKAWLEEIARAMKIPHRPS